ncbi:MAG: hypothetical protein PHH14_04170 [Candidatus Margulisbacteria bacterium]|nr:hypothetical protein [Candidatus Margulisiibacteriota bacterium]
MNIRFTTIAVILLCLIVPALAQPQPEVGLYSNEYYLSFYPEYPPIVGETVTIRLRTFKPAHKVTLFSDREKEITMKFRDGYWWGSFDIPDDYKAGGHFFTVWIRYPFPEEAKPKDVFSNVAKLLRLKKDPGDRFWSKSVIGYKMVKKLPTDAAVLGSPEATPVFTPEAEFEEPLIVTGEAVTIPGISTEASPFLIKGTKTLAFSIKSITGTKEGFSPGVTREEALRLNIAGKTDGTEVNANLITTSTVGSAQVAQKEEKISVLVKRASTEVYLGDFNGEYNETEFTKLDKVLSGARVKGEYGTWGFNALYSSPKGESQLKRMYGDNTQGPFMLDFAPVVIDSERVYLDGNLQKRGDDYTIDYQAGTITFTKKTIDSKSVLNIYYDYSQTVYQHSTYGLRLTAKPYPNLKLGATYLNDSDSLAGAADIRQSMQTDPVDPQGLYVVGVDGALVSENLTVDGELAYSNKNYNLLAAGSEEAGKAVKLDLTTQQGPFGLSAHGKRVGATFQPLFEPDPKQNVTDYGGALSFRPSSLFGAQGDYNYEKYTQSEVDYENLNKSVKLSLTPEQLPSLEYNFLEQDESNDPVTGDPIRRIITRHSAESAYRLGILSATLKGTKERWLDRSPEEAATYYKRINVGLATVGLERFTFTSNVELEDRRMPDLTTPYRRTYNLNMSVSPAKQYFLSSSVEYLEDSAQGNKNVTDVSYRAEPNEMIRTDGKYTVTSVNEDYATTEVVSKQTGSFSLDLRPLKLLRLKYLYKPNFTRALRTDTITYNNEQQQAEVNLLPLSDVMLGLIYKVGHGFNIYKPDPNLTIKDNTSDTDSALYTIKMAPFRIFSVEFDYLLENGRTTQRVTDEAYLPGQTFNKKFDAIVRTSLSETFSIDSRYTYQRGLQGSGEASANLANSSSHSASLKGTWNITEVWSVYASGAYSRNTDLLAAQPVSYTLTPGAGFSCRQGDKFRLDFDYTYSKSYAGAVTELTKYSLRGKYGLSDYVNVTIRAEQETSRAPDYRLTDITGNIEINL